MVIIFMLGDKMNLEHEFKKRLNLYAMSERRIYNIAACLALGVGLVLMVVAIWLH